MLDWRLLKAASGPPLKAPVHVHRLFTFQDHLQRILNNIAAQRHLFHPIRHTLLDAFTSIYYLAVAAESGQTFLDTCHYEHTVLLKYVLRYRISYLLSCSSPAFAQTSEWPGMISPARIRSIAPSALPPSPLRFIFGLHPI